MSKKHSRLVAPLSEKDAKLLATARAQMVALELLSALNSIVGFDEFETEYDGRMYSMCPDCGDLDKNGHHPACAFAAARAVIAKAEGTAP